MFPLPHTHADRPFGPASGGPSSMASTWGVGDAPIRTPPSWPGAAPVLSGRVAALGCGHRVDSRCIVCFWTGELDSTGPSPPGRSHRPGGTSFVSRGAGNPKLVAITPLGEPLGGHTLYPSTRRCKPYNTNMTTRDPVMPETHELVMRRDELALVTWARKRGWSAHGRVICVAPIIDPEELERCRGRMTLDHIKDEPRLAKRAPSDPAHLVSLCEGHTENGAKAGRQWNTAHRPELRDYLRRENK